jgi:hypothetical protein
MGTKQSEGRDESKTKEEYDRDGRAAQSRGIQELIRGGQKMKNNDRDERGRGWLSRTESGNEKRGGASDHVVSPFSPGCCV